MKEEEQSIRLESTFDSGPSLGNNKWKKMGDTLSKNEPNPTLLRIDLLLENNTLRGNRTFQFFVARMRQWNKKINSGSTTRKEQRLFDFLYTHLKTISSKSDKVQQVLMEKLSTWFHDNITPKPKISDILKDLKKTKQGSKFPEENLVRKTFTSNLSLSINNFYRRQLGKTFSEEEFSKMVTGINKPQTSAEEKMVLRLHRRDQQNLRTWRQQTQLADHIKLATGSRSRREEESFKTVPNFRKTYTVNLRSRHYPDTRVMSEKKKALPIAGLTLIANPFETKNK